jgi:uroporphyrinogen decarboxylase
MGAKSRRDGGAAAADGIHGLVPRDRMTPAARKMRDTYAITPGAPLYRREFGWYCLEAWQEQGLPKDADLAAMFQFDPPGKYDLGGAGWCEAAFVPEFERKVIEPRGEYEVIQDNAGRLLLVFRGRRDGFMPEYLDHPVKDMRSWQEKCKWRMDPATPERWAKTAETLAAARTAAAGGLMITQWVSGPYMYLRSLIGPEELLYAFYDMPEVVHDCMQTWLRLADAVTARHQQEVTFDEIFFGEDICYNHGPLISPEMMREFIFPYYQQLIANVRARQLDRARRLFVQVDSDGDVRPLIPLYQQGLGMDVCSPFEVASGCDVVEQGRQYPHLVMTGGIDKRILAESPAAIDRMVERILPAMRRRGGYIPTCDHGVPAEVSLANYLHYRKRCVELGG